MSKFNKKVDRRKALGWGVGGFIGGNLGLTGLDMIGTQLPRNTMFEKVWHALDVGNIDALAQANDATDICVFNISVNDKVSEYLLHAYPNIGITQNGISGVIDAGAGTNVMYNGRSLANKVTGTNNAFRQMGLTDLCGEWFTEILLNNRFNISTIALDKGGNHVMNDHQIDGKGSVGYLAEATGKTGTLGHVSFAGDSATNSLESTQGPGGLLMPAFNSISEMRQVMKNSVAALPKRGSKAYEMRKRLDQLAIKDSKTLGILDQIYDKAAPALEQLLDVLTEPDSLMAQTRAAIILAKTGLGSNFHLSCIFDDTNGGGDMRDDGGNVIGMDGYNPLQGHAALCRTIATIGQELGDRAIIMISTDGGRDGGQVSEAGARTQAAGGDAGGTTVFLCGPDTHINEFGKGNWRGFGALGNAQDNGLYMIRFSDGTTARRVSPPELMSAVLMIAYDFNSEHRYPTHVATDAEGTNWIPISPKFA